MRIFAALASILFLAVPAKAVSKFDFIAKIPSPGDFRQQAVDLHIAN
jgi:aspartyl/asparaginyl beta-hydroxylase (cupin superfamily)